MYRFFFFKQKTAYEMRISDWSSDVCSSDLALAGVSPDPNAAVAALPDTSEICGCNGVCKGTIVTAIATHGLTTLDGVRAHTKASASCGSSSEERRVGKECVRTCRSRW